MNVSMHDSFNLAWKLNLAVRGVAAPSLLPTYSLERRKIAQDLIAFDASHMAAFATGDAALAKNFDDNIRFISGVGAEYLENVLNKPEKSAPRGGLRAGALLPPARVSRYIDANPVDIQLDIPMLGQFRIYFFAPDIHASMTFLEDVCKSIQDSASTLARVSALAKISYANMRRSAADSDAFVQPGRYIAVSEIFTFALVTSTAKQDVEIADLPDLLQDSRWTFYLDDLQRDGGEDCTEKWLGSMGKSDVAIVNVRPDGYVGSISRWDVREAGEGSRAGTWLSDYYGAFLGG